VAEVLESVGLSDAEKELREPSRTLAFECKCGCDLFRVEVDTYANGTWAAVILCAACGKSVCPTEPITNGPH